MRAVTRLGNPLSAEIDGALAALDSATAPGSAAVQSARLQFVLTQVSRRIDEVVGDHGLDDPRGWELLAVRDEIDSHVLAATVLVDSNADAARVLDVLAVGRERARDRLLLSRPH